MEIRIVLFNAVLVFPSETKKDKKSILKTFLNFPQMKTHKIEIFCKVDSTISLKYKLYFNFASCFKMLFSIPQRTLKTFA